MKKIIKTLSYVILSFMLIASNIYPVFAADFKVTASKTTVSPQSTVTITIKVDGEGKFSMSAKNAKLSESVYWVNGTYSFSAKVGESGTSTITVTAEDVASNSAEEITGSKTVTINIKKPAETKPVTKPQNNQQTVKPDTSEKEEKPTTNVPDKTDKEDVNENKEPLSDDNYLQSLEVSSGSLTPVFNKDVQSYFVSLTSDTESININALANDNKAKVEGNGSHNLVIGKQNIKITCTSESGKKRTYTISVDVKETPIHFINYKNEKLGLLYDVKDAPVPKSFKEGTLTIEGRKIKSWTHETSKIQIIYLMNESGQKHMYIYDDGQIVSLYETIEILGETYVLCAIPEELKKQNQLVLSEIVINDKQFEGWTYENEQYKDYVVAYLINEKGEKNLYSFDQLEGTIQRFVSIEENEEMVNLFNHQCTYSQAIKILSCASLILLCTTLTYAYLYFHNQKVYSKKLSALREKYENEYEQFMDNENPCDVKQNDENKE